MSIDFSGGSFAQDPYYASTGPYAGLSGEEWVQAVEGSTLWNAVNNPTYDPAKANPDIYGAYPYTPNAGPKGGGGASPGGGGYDPYGAYMANQESNRRRNAIAALRGILESMGLGSLMNKITQYVQDGYDEGAVLALIRDTPEYQQRFPAMKALAAKGRAISEATYIEYEKAAAGYERQYGLPAGLLGKDQITNLLTKEVSARELEERVTMAAAAAYQTSDDVKQVFNDYYGIGPGGLTAYFLDPDAATPLLNRQYVSSKIGGEARRQGIGVDKSLAELLQIGGVTAEDARAGFAKVAQQRGLTSGYGDVVSERQLIGAALQNDTEAQQAVERAGMARVGAFQGNFGYSGNQSGASGLRAATTG